MAPIGFDRVAHDYESSRPLPLSIAQALAQRVTRDLSPQDWYLDVGVGTGRIARAIAARHRRTAGIDIAPAMLRRAIGVQGVLADALALPFAAEAFAGVLSVHLLHLMPTWPEAIEEMWRVLRPGGVLTLGFEDRGAMPVRDHYLRAARRRGALPPHPGGSAAAIAEKVHHLPGAKVRSVRPRDLRWEATESVATMLEQLHRRTFSQLWGIPEAIHVQLLADTRAFAQHGPETERHAIRFLLIEAKK